LARVQDHGFIPDFFSWGFRFRFRFLLFTFFFLSLRAYLLSVAQSAKLVTPHSTFVALLILCSTHVPIRTTPATDKFESCRVQLHRVTLPPPPSPLPESTACLRFPTQPKQAFTNPHQKWQPKPPKPPKQQDRRRPARRRCRRSTRPRRRGRARRACRTSSRRACATRSASSAGRTWRRATRPSRRAGRICCGI
jgi:hypothetical protein